MAAQAMPHRQSVLMDAKGISETLRVGGRTLWRWIASGQFPKPDISIGGKIRRWKRETVEMWIEQQANGGSHA